MEGGWGWGGFERSIILIRLQLDCLCCCLSNFSRRKNTLAADNCKMKDFFSCLVVVVVRSEDAIVTFKGSFILGHPRTRITKRIRKRLGTVEILITGKKPSNVMFRLKIKHGMNKLQL